MNGSDCSDLRVKPADGPSESGPTAHERSVGTSSLVIKGQHLIVEGGEDVSHEFAKLTFATVLGESFDAIQNLGDVRMRLEQNDLIRLLNFAHVDDPQELKLMQELQERFCWKVDQRLTRS